jgi:hypothetical protein
MAALNTTASKEYFGELTVRLLATARADDSRKERSVHIPTLRGHSF